MTVFKIRPSTVLDFTIGIKYNYSKENKGIFKF